MEGTRIRRTLAGGLIVLLSLALAIPASASPADWSDHPQPAYPEGESEYVHATGHFIRGPFLEFYYTAGGARVFGNPQTEVFYDAQIGLWVQYFDNVRMEWHPENPELYQVQLGLLGEVLGYRTPPIATDQIPRGNPFRRYFGETGHVVSFAFLNFYDQNGGLDIFGYPISEPTVENGRIVQYFQRAQMEWHPERERDDRVTLGALGIRYLQRFPVPPEYRNSLPFNEPSNIQAPTAVSPDLSVWPFVRNVVTGREGYQTVYVYVTDGSRQPVTGAEAVITVQLPSGTVDYTATPTDSRGITSVSFPIHSLPPGQKVVVDVTVRSGARMQTAQTFFVPWY